MLSIARYLHAKFWLAVAWLVILLAILLTTLRLVLPAIDLASYQREIERIVEQRAGKSLAIGGMQAELKGFRLALKFSEVSLFNKDATHPLLHAREVHIGIELLRSLLNGRLELGSATVIGTRLKLRHHSDGGISLQGLEGGGGGDGEGVEGLLLGQSHLRLYDSEILFKGALPDSAPVRLSGVAVDLLNREGRHQLSIKAKIGPQAEEAVRLIAELEEGKENALAFNGRLYVKCEGLKIGERLAEWLPRGYRVDRGALQTELWGDLRDGRLRRLRGTLELEDLQVGGPAAQAPFHLQRFATRLHWRQVVSGWQLDLDRLVLARAGKLWPPGRLSLAWQAGEVLGRQFRVGADYLSLKELNDFISIIELPNRELGEALSGLSADGHLTRFGFTLLRPPEGEVQWRIAGRVARYGNRPWQSVPGLAGLRLSFEGNQSGGWLHLDSSDFTIEFPRLFRKPLAAKRLSGDFTWRFNTRDGLHLSGNRLVMRNADVETLSRLELQLPLSGTDPFIDLQTDFWNGNAARKSDYLPVGIMRAPLVEWLDRSVVDGHVNSGSFLFYGPVKAFPFYGQEGRFEVWFGVEDLILDYQPGWPRIEQGVTEVHFINNSLQVSLKEGLLLGNRLAWVDARIRALKGGAPVQIEGELNGPFDNMLKLLSETPLREHFADFTNGVEVSGGASTRLSLEIPLKKSDTLKVAGKVKLDGAGLKIKAADLPLEAISGELTFDEKQLTGKAIQARLLGQQVAIDITPKLLKRGRWTRIATRLSLDAKQLRRQFPDWWLPPMRGTAQSDVNVEFAHQTSRVPVRLKVSSNLSGVAVGLPAPLGKPAAAARKTTLSVDFRADRNIDLGLRYGSAVRALLRLPRTSRQSLQGAIGFSEPPTLPKKGKGFRITGRVPALDVDRWLEWIDEQASGGRGENPQLEIDLRVERLAFAAMKCPEAHLTLRNYANGYRSGIDSKTLKGQIQVPGDLQRLPLLGRFDFIKLDITELTSGISGPGSEKNGAVNFDPRRLPALDLSVDNLYINDSALGKSHLSWQKQPDGITLNQLSVVGDKLQLTGMGYWRRTDKGHRTALNLSGHIANLGNLQREMGLTTGIEDAPTDIKAEFYWPTSPLNVSARSLYGSIGLKIGKGQAKNMDPGVGRLIGLFSLNALGKRLALDFRDIFYEGLNFDSIEGNFTIQNGVAHTSDLVLQSSSARIDFSGDTGLADRTYDQRVVVTPHLSATLPLVGALAVNPSVGVALAVTQKLLGKQFDKIARRTYEVHGSWDEPVFKLIAKQKPPETEMRNEAFKPDLPGR